MMNSHSPVQRPTDYLSQERYATSYAHDRKCVSYVFVVTRSLLRNAISNSERQNMRINLDVKFKEKDKARRLGARWDPARNCWYVEDHEDLEPFLRWMPHHLRMPHEQPVNRLRPVGTAN
jgi:Domain of unknown function (DUF5710)